MDAAPSASEGSGSCSSRRGQVSAASAVLRQPSLPKGTWSKARNRYSQEAAPSELVTQYRAGVQCVHQDLPRMPSSRVVGAKCLERNSQGHELPIAKNILEVASTATFKKSGFPQARGHAQKLFGAHHSAAASLTRHSGKGLEAYSTSKASTSSESSASGGC